MQQIHTFLVCCAGLEVDKALCKAHNSFETKFIAKIMALYKQYSAGLQSTRSSTHYEPHTLLCLVVELVIKVASLIWTIALCSMHVLKS